MESPPMVRPEPGKRHPDGYEWCVIVGIQGQQLQAQTIYAWSLNSALHKAQALPLSEWLPDDEPPDLTAARKAGTVRA